ncbi:MAG TPA: hypothetical protein VFG70_01130, partial [Gaiellaceae bacterium]|nr:hypothetical protein [Gaiellaceae bacterium]
MDVWKGIGQVVAGRRGKFVVLGSWLLLVGALGPLAGRFETVQENEPSSFLPESAESVAVLEAANGFRAGESTPAIAVFRNPAGLGEEGREAAQQARERIASAGLAGVGRVPPPAFSADGTAAVVPIPIT